MCNMQFDVKIRRFGKFWKLLKLQCGYNCILTSSVPGILGGIGHSAYFVSNLFMDFFAKLQNKTAIQDGLLWLGISGSLIQIEKKAMLVLQRKTLLYQETKECGLFQ